VPRRAMLVVCVLSLVLLAVTSCVGKRSQATAGRHPSASAVATRSAIDVETTASAGPIERIGDLVVRSKKYSGTRPSDLPTDIPFYPNSKDRDVGRILYASGTVTWILSPRTDDPIDRVQDWYVSALRSGGWTLDKVQLVSKSWRKAPPEVTPVAWIDARKGAVSGNVRLKARTEVAGKGTQIIMVFGRAASATVDAPRAK
jgi:hypothetical protein